ncbi:tryptophan 7-halogenase [Psychrosphaera aquimarina]|uniref:Tryptophan 7-halogenase n=1 Tax=Psychrosphaera aquimarina TaxID=2044854 RepID=A0ABU3R2H1_9GAMM|nr:tryptophan 7-halogenase [Psychrosphaera aquimarina]MDU0113874.1 tryptophan 7-halogenase [Psychrosphaera aquimarina]
MNTRPNDILICGGGTAGWMAANLFMHNWPGANVTLIESDNIGIIGVGEGSTPSLKQFFKILGISDQEWMPQCNATYKVGIRFPNWSDKQGYESYFHPFFSELDIKPGEPFFITANYKEKAFPQMHIRIIILLQHKWQGKKRLPFLINTLI